MQERWLILAVLTFARTAMGFQFQSVAAASPLLVEQFSLSYAGLGTLIGLYLLPGIVVAIPGGLLAQRFGDKFILMLGLAAMAAGGALMGLADNMILLGIGRVLSGAGGVMANLLTTKMLTDWFAGREIATAFGLLVISWPLGIAAALVVLPLFASAWSWQAMMHVPAAISALAILLTALCYRTPSEGAPKPPGTLRFDLSRRESILVAIAGLIWTFYNVGFVMVPAFGPAFAVTSGLSPAAAGAVVSTMTWFVIPAVPLSAWLAQRLGRADVAMHASFALSAVALALLALSGPSVTLFALIGLCFAPPGGLIMTLPGEVLRPECRALGMGIFLTVYYAGIGILPALAGYARDVTGNAATPFWFAVALVLAAAVTLLLFRRLQARTVQVRDTLR